MGRSNFYEKISDLQLFGVRHDLNWQIGSTRFRENELIFLISVPFADES